MSVDVEAKYGIDMSQVRRLEARMEERLPDILQPLRQADADFDRIKASLVEYRTIADELDTLSAGVARAHAELAWQESAGDSSRNALDWILLVLGRTGASILFVIAALLMLVALIMFAIGAILQLIGKAIAAAAAAVAVIVTIIVIIRSGGRGNTGHLTRAWAALRAVFNEVHPAVLGIAGALGDGFGWVTEQCARAIMWLVEVGGRWTQSPTDDLTRVRKERNELFADD